jgi:hypothetical protein
LRYTGIPEVKDKQAYCVVVEQIIHKFKPDLTDAMKIISGILFIISFSDLSFSQSAYAPLNSDYYNIIDRFDIAGYPGNIFTSVKPYLRKDIAAFADAILKDTLSRLSLVDKRDLRYLQDDNWEWSKSADSGNSKRPVLKELYRKKNAFYAVNSKDFLLQVNPVAYFSYGKDYDQTTYLNSRGFELRGLIDNKIGFYTFLTDNQSAFPQYVDTRIAATGVIPGEGFWKNFHSNGYDFYTANGYVDFKITKHISTQFGQDKNFIGDGYRSLMLSDNSSNYLFWKIDTKIGRLEYVNLFAQMVADPSGNSGGTPGDVLYPRKYMALHYLNLKVTRNFNIGFFESITFGNTDSIHNRGFDLDYLNPVVFYNAVENGLGAPDKDHVGVNWKWNFLHHCSLYGTILLDEFNISELRSNNGWWGNKQAAQLGLKFTNVLGIPNLDMQLEGNVVPPYTYSTYSFSTVTNYSYFANYSNYGQALADPNGANFYEGIGILKYQPFYRFSFTGKLLYTVTGLDSIPLPGRPQPNYGSNIMLSNTTRASDYGNYITQGVRTTILYFSLTASYQLAHNMFIDLSALIRQEKSQTSYYNSTDRVFSVSFRWNIAQRLQEF